MTVSQGGAGGAGDRGPLPVDQERAVVARLNLLAAHFYRDRMPGSWVPPYLQARGLSPAAQAHWHAGYAPASWDALTHHLRALGYADELIERAGLARQSQRGSLIDVFRDRAVFPILSSTGTVAGFIGRARDARIAGAPKYLNTPRTCVYDKSRLLFGLYEARTALAAGARPVIVEGPFDAIAVTAAGKPQHAGVATVRDRPHRPAHRRARPGGGPARERGSSRRIRLGCQPASEPLSAPITCSVRSRTRSMSLTSSLARIRRTSSRSQGPTALARMLTSRTRPLADVVIDNEVERWSRWMCYPEGQVHALRAAARLIATMPPSHVGRQVSRLASRLEFRPCLRDRGRHRRTYGSYCSRQRQVTRNEVLLHAV